MAANQDTDEAVDGLGASPAQKSSKLLGLLLFVNLLVSGTALFKILNLPTEPTIIDAIANATNNEEDDDDEELDLPGPIHAFDTFIVNLNEAGGGRFLRVTVEVEVKDENALVALQTNERRVKDEILRFLSNLRVDEALGEENRLKIQDGIATRVNPLIGGDEEDNRVKRIYFPDFVVQ